MTATVSAPSGFAAFAVSSIGVPRLLAGAANLADHHTVHGPYRQPNRVELLAHLDAVALTGRGGAGFPLAAKIRALRPGATPVIVVNATEGEPGSAKDTVLLTRTPHLVADGAAAIAVAVGAARVIVAVTDAHVESQLRHAVGQRPDARLFEVRRVPDRFIVGEARTLVRVIDGGPALPPGRRVLPTERGVGGAPTLVSNAETFAQVGVLLRTGPAGFASVGTSDQPGTTLLTVSGAVARPAVLEVPFGTSLDAIADTVGAVPAQAIVIGGYHGSWIKPDLSLRLDRLSLASAGARLGAGVVIFLSQHTCGLAELARAAQWLAGESAKQCGPCAFGLPAIAENLGELAAGRRASAVLNRRLGAITGRGACAHPDGAVRFISSAGQVLAEEIAVHLQRQSCGRQLRAELPLSKAAAFASRA
jgi:NADH:ubiquinone oxidoreductase subunit F (NADH-binding)